MRNLIIVFLTLLSLITAWTLYAGEIDTLPKTGWERKFGDADYTYQNKSIAVAANDNSLFIAGIFSSTDRAKSQRDVMGIWIWKINDDGEKKLDIRVKNTQDQNSNLIDVEAMAVTGEGNIIILARSQTNQTSFLRMNAKGDILLTKKLDQDSHIFKIIQTTDKKYLLIGKKKADALLMKIDENGEIVWSKIYARANADMFIDGVALEDGSFILIENTGKVEQFFIGVADIWIIKCDANGQKQSERTFTGRYGSIARIINDGYAVLYDKSSTAKQDIWLKTFDKNITEANDVNITSTDFGLERFNIFSLKNGDYIVGGTLDLRPWVSYVDSTGTKKWYFQGKTTEPAVGAAYASINGNIYIVSSVVGINEQYQQVNKIRVTKFQP